MFLHKVFVLFFCEDSYFFISCYAHLLTVVILDKL